MQIRKLPDLSEVAVVSDFVFDAHNADLTELIKRYRGTVVTDGGSTVIAWQKSIYHFGGLTREVPIVITLKLGGDGCVASLDIDRRSNGSQGARCSFPCLEQCIGSKLVGRKIADILELFQSAADAKCLHIYEILAGAASFCAHLEGLGQTEGSEQELFTITPTKTGLLVDATHEVLGKKSETELVVRYENAPVLNKFNLPESLSGSVLVRFDGAAVRTEKLDADSFEMIYAQLNRLASRCYNLEKKRFGLSGRVKFSNCPSMSGLLLLAMSHQALKGTVGRAIEVERILHYLQTGYHANPCKGFGG